MLDLIEGAKVIDGLTASTMGIAKGNCDWINMENLHTIWVIATHNGTSGPVLTPVVSEDYAGTSSSSAAAGITVWHNNASTTLDRYTKSTALFATMSDALKTSAVIRFEPAAVPLSTNSHFSIHRSSCVGPLSVTYIAQPRYAGSQQFIATTSST